MNFKKEANSAQEKLVFILVLLFVAMVSFFLGSQIFPQNSKTSSSLISAGPFDKLNDIFQVINKEFYYKDRLTSSKIEDSSIKGYLSGLEDAPTRYLNTSEYSQYKEVISGNIFGIGVEIGIYNDGSKINTVYPETPAFKAGLKKGDIILKIDEKDASKMSPSDVASLVRGIAGTKVNLTVQRDDKSLTLEITRDKIYTSSVNYENLNTSNICKITITRFTDESVDKWKSNWNTAVDKFLGDGCKKLVVDLRNNGGGYVDAAKYALGEFINDGTYIYGQKKNNGTIDKYFADRNKNSQSQLDSSLLLQGRLKDVPVVILINSSSASASEIFSGSMQVLGRAKLVGINSYGKGSVQDTKEFSDKSALIYTIANWSLPNDQIIDQNFPIKPDFVIVNSLDDVKKDKDPQQDKAIDLLK